MQALNRVVSFFRDNDLCLMQSNREDGFVILPRCAFNEKALQAVNKNFKCVKVSLTKVEKNVGKLCEEVGGKRLSKQISKSKADSLLAFLGLKPTRLICRSERLSVSGEHMVLSFFAAKAIQDISFQ